MGIAAAIQNARELPLSGAAPTQILFRLGATSVFYFERLTGGFN